MTRTIALATTVLAVAVAGCGSDNSSSSNSSSDTASTPAAAAPTTSSGGGASSKLQVAADPSGQLKFDKSSLTAKAGNVSIVMDNPSDVPHGVGIKGNGV